MNNYEKDRCMKIINKLISFPICYPFLEMIDPVRDGAPDYFEFVKEPMALAEVKRKLARDNYKTIDDFKRDVNLIWSNAVTYNGEGTITDMALEAKYWFEKKMKKFPSSSAEEWTRKIQKTTRRFYKVLAHPPPELDPSGHLMIHMPSDDDNIDLEALMKEQETHSSASESESENENDNNQSKDENKQETEQKEPENKDNVEQSNTDNAQLKEVKKETTAN